MTMTSLCLLTEHVCGGEHTARSTESPESICRTHGGQSSLFLPFYNTYEAEFYIIISREQ